MCAVCSSAYHILAFKPSHWVVDWSIIVGGNKLTDMVSQILALDFIIVDQVDATTFYRVFGFKPHYFKMIFFRNRNHTTDFQFFYFIEYIKR